ncbi:MAG: hypothetical protein VW397_02395 [Candidatus Margulisiibacteriota bacterium]
MKKSTILILFLAIFSTVMIGAPRFGLMTEQDHGLGAMVSLDQINAHVLVNSTYDDAPSKTDLTSISVALDYKLQLESNINLLLGIGYVTKSGDYEGKALDKWTIMSIHVGLVRPLSDNILISSKINLYEQATYDDSATSEYKITRIFSDARMGVGVLF